MDELLSSISGVIRDYRDGEFGSLDEEHVSRWNHQFPLQDRLVVLEETNRILKRTYITKLEFQSFIKSLVVSEKFASNQPRVFWQHASLANIQINGNSQKELVSLVQSEVEKNYGIAPRINAVSDHHIYIDDFLFSGTRLVTDMRKWISESAPSQCHVSIVLMGWYQSGIWYVQRELKKLARENNKQITFKYWSSEECRLDNRLSTKDNSHVFWPEQNVMEIPSIRTYIQRQNRDPVFREFNGIENKIFSIRRRSQYEAAMLSAGVQILSFCQDPSPVVKPLGYSRFDGFGFGSTVFSFRNCPNNNPLAFWWGDPTSSRSHPFSRWYPLMQRRAY